MMCGDTQGEKEGRSPDKEPRPGRQLARCEAAYIQGVYGTLEHGIDMLPARSKPQQPRKEHTTLTSEKGSAEGQEKNQSSTDKAIDKAQEKRQGGGSPDAVDKAVDKAQESGLTDKAAQKAKDRFSK